MSGALRTAAGVAGGIAVADLFGNLLGGHGGGGGGLFGNAGFGGGEQVHETVNNFYDTPNGGPQSQDANWSDPGTQQDFAQDASFDNSANFDDGGNFDDNSGGSIDT